MPRPAADSNVFAVIADPTRRAILDMLREGERPVSALVESFAMTQPAVSQHLQILRRAGLVSHRRLGRLRLYHVRPAGLREVADWVSPYEKFWTQKLDNLGKYLDRTFGPKRPRPPT